MYIPLQNYSHYSVLDSILKPAEIAKHAADLGFPAAAITDLGNMSGIVQFISACKEKGIKPIIGVTLSFTDNGTFVLLAKNYDGYKELLKITSFANTQDNYINGARITIDQLKEFDTSNLYLLIGHEGSSLYHKVYNQAGDFMQDNALSAAHHLLTFLNEVMPKGHSFIQVDPNFHYKIQEIYQELALKLGWSTLITSIVQYRDNHNTELYDIIKATQLKTTVKNLPTVLYKGFLDPNTTNCETSQQLANSIEEFEVQKPPSLPSFPCPDEMSSKDYIRQLCWDSMKRLKLDSNQEYIDRIAYEIKVVEEAGMMDYFLIIRDILEHARQQGFLTGPGRGSAAGCLMSYLLGITQIDPLKYDLIFERFYSAARKNVLPDIDIDIPKKARDILIQYVFNKYGQNYTAQVATYQTLMGRAALKAVFRALDSCTFAEMNEITKHLEDKAKIADELQEMKDNGLQPSVILWALDNRPARFKQYCTLNEFTSDGYKLGGPMAKEFDLAIRLEGIKSAKSKHAAAVIIGSQPLGEIVPMIWDEKTQKQIVGVEFEDAEKMSLCKIDLLGLATLDKIMDM